MILKCHDIIVVFLHYTQQYMFEDKLSQIMVFNIHVQG
jgi:hypothetical protein